MKNHVAVHHDGWTSIVKKVGDDGIWVDWSYVEGDGSEKFVPHGEYQVVDTSGSLLDGIKKVQR